MLVVAGKIFAKIMETRFNKNIAEKLLSDSQCGFRADRSTCDSMFVCRPLLEKSRELSSDYSRETSPGVFFS